MQTRFLISQLIMFYVFDHHQWPLSGTVSDGGRNVDASRKLLVVK